MKHLALRRLPTLFVGKYLGYTSFFYVLTITLTAIALNEAGRAYATLNLYLLLGSGGVLAFLTMSLIAIKFTRPLLKAPLTVKWVIVALLTLTYTYLLSQYSYVNYLLIQAWLIFFFGWMALQVLLVSYTALDWSSRLTLKVTSPKLSLITSYLTLTALLLLIILSTLTIPRYLLGRYTLISKLWCSMILSSAILTLALVIKRRREVDVKAFSAISFFTAILWIYLIYRATLLLLSLHRFEARSEFSVTDYLFMLITLTLLMSTLKSKLQGLWSEEVNDPSTFLTYALCLTYVVAELYLIFNLGLTSTLIPLMGHAMAYAGGLLNLLFVIKGGGFKVNH